MMEKFDRSIFINRFKQVADDNIARLNKGFLELEKDLSNIKLIDELMREAHSFKGSAVMMERSDIGGLAHRIESVLEKYKNKQIEFNRKDFDLLFECLDTIKLLVEEAVTGQVKDVDREAVEKKMDEAFELEEMNALSKKAAPAPDENPQNPPPPSAKASIPEKTVHVAVNKLDNLIDLMGELIIDRIRFDQRREEFSGLIAYVLKVPSLDKDLKKRLRLIQEGIDESGISLTYAISNLQEAVMGVRMLPLSTIFMNFPRVMRDLASQLGKEIDFEVKGEEIELDKGILELIEEPVMHLLRNAVGHGIETADKRKKSGKPGKGKVSLMAQQKANQVIIEVEDDGAGIDVNKIKEIAFKENLINKEDAENLSDKEMLRLIFSLKVSTAREVDQVSGRGIGLDVVRNNISRLKGILDVESEPGKGAKFIIKLPLSLAVRTAILVKANQETFAVGLDSIEETLRIKAADIDTVDNNETITLRSHAIPLVRLADILKLTEIPAYRENSTHSASSGQADSGLRFDNTRRRGVEASIPVVVVASADKRIAILVDELLGKQDVVVKPLEGHLRNVRSIAGATILGSGEVVLILDIDSLIEESGKYQYSGERTEQRERKEAGKKVRLHNILIVEDSSIDQDLEKSILQQAGYGVDIAGDGNEALVKLARKRYDLIVTDIVMPNMDGFELLKRLKDNDEYKNIPVIIISTGDNRQDRKKGLELGVGAYILKTAFNRLEFIDTVQRLIG